MTTNSNDFKAFAVGNGANVEAPANWATETVLQLGFQAGIAPSMQVNTAIRQASSIAAAIAQFMADYGTSNVQDNGNIATLEQQFVAAISLLVSDTLPTNLVFNGSDTGTANAANLSTANPPLSSASAFDLFLVKKSAAANTGAMTFETGSATANLVWEDGTALVEGDWPASTLAFIAFDGTQFRLLSVMGPTVFARASQVQPILTANANYFVNASTGNDNNNGLTSGTAFATIQRALSVVSKFNLNGFNVTINVANGTYTGPILLPIIGGSGSITLLGNTSSPASVVVTSSTGSAIQIQGAVNYVINGFTLECSGTSVAGDPGAGLWAQGGGAVLENIQWGACLADYLASDFGALITLGSAQIIAASLTSGGTGFEANAASITALAGAPPVFSIPSAVSVPTFAGATQGGLLLLVGATFTGASNVTGNKFSATLNGIINTNTSNVNFFPGSSAGSASSGGQYA